MTTATYSLSKRYGSFFGGCVQLAVSPYLIGLELFTKDPKNMHPKDLALGVGACLFFTFVVPILPAITSVTFSLAAFGACIALASMFITYPVAFAMDIVDMSSRGDVLPSLVNSF